MVRTLADYEMARALLVVPLLSRNSGKRHKIGLETRKTKDTKEEEDEERKIKDEAHPLYEARLSSLLPEGL